MIWQLVRISARASIHGSDWGVAHLILLRFLAPLRDVALAAYSITNRLQNFSNLGGNGIAQASGVKVEQNLGPGKLERAKQAMW